MMPARQIARRIHVKRSSVVPKSLRDCELYFPSRDSDAAIVCHLISIISKPEPIHNWDLRK